MILEIVRGFMGAGIITDSGIKMPIGNMIFNVGDPVYTDGEYAFGHSPERGKFINFIDAKELCFKLALMGNMGNEAKIATFTVRNNKIILVKNEELDITNNVPRFYFSANNKTVGFFHWFYNPIEGPSSYGKINYYFNGNWYSLEHSAEVKDILSQVKTYPYSAEVIDLYSASNLPPYDEWPEKEVDYYEVNQLGGVCYSMFLENKFTTTILRRITFTERRHTVEWYWADRAPTEREIEKNYVNISYDDNGNPLYKYKVYDLGGKGTPFRLAQTKLSIDTVSSEVGVEHSLIMPLENSDYVAPYAATNNPNEFRYNRDWIVRLTNNSYDADFYHEDKKELSLKLQIKYTGDNILEIARYISDFRIVIRIADDTYITDDERSKIKLVHKGEIIDSYDLGQFTYAATNLSEPFFK